MDRCVSFECVGTGEIKSAIVTEYELEVIVSEGIWFARD